MARPDFVEVAKVDEVPVGRMKHIELNGKEIMIVNLDGKFYALNDRCSHTNAALCNAASDYISLRTAQLKDTYELDKVHGSEYTDLLDCLRMCTFPLRFHGM